MKVYVVIFLVVGPCDLTGGHLEWSESKFGMWDISQYSCCPDYINILNHLEVAELRSCKMLVTTYRTHHHRPEDHGFPRELTCDRVLKCVHLHICAHFMTIIVLYFVQLHLHIYVNVNRYSSRVNSHLATEYCYVKCTVHLLFCKVPHF